MPRSNKDRSSETQNKILLSAVDCLCEVGYTGTTINMVAKHAEISKGAMLHHFATKSDLMISVARFCVEANSKLRHKYVAETPKGAGPMTRLVKSSKKIIGHPSYVALIEIMMATRNDPEIKAQFSEVAELMEKQQDASVVYITEITGLKSSPQIRALMNLHVNFLVGILIQKMAGKNKESLDQQFELIELYENLAIEHFKKQK